MRINTLKDRIANWEILHTNAAPQLGEMPQVTGDLAELERILQSGKALEADRGDHLMALSVSARHRQTLIEDGDAVFRRLTLALRARFGPKSEQLIKYGLTPEKTRRRKGRGGSEAAAAPEGSPASS